MIPAAARIVKKVASDSQMRYHFTTVCITIAFFASGNKCRMLCQLRLMFYFFSAALSSKAISTVFGNWNWSRNMMKYDVPSYRLLVNKEWQYVIFQRKRRRLYSFVSSRLQAIYFLRSLHPTPTPLQFCNVKFHVFYWSNQENCRAIFAAFRWQLIYNLYLKSRLISWNDLFAFRCLFSRWSNFSN